MIKIDKEDIEVSGDYEVVLKEWMSLNIGLAYNIAQVKLDNFVIDIDNEDYKKMVIDILEELKKDCVKFIEKENSK